MSKYFYLLIFLPLTASILCLFFKGHPKLERWTTVTISFIYAVFGLTLLFSFSASQSMVAGGWSQGIGIGLKYDSIAAMMMAIVGLIYFTGALYGVRGKTVESHRNYQFLYNSLFFGLTGAFLTSDLFNLFVWFEITLMSSYVLVVLGDEKKRLQGGLKYIVLNFFSSLIFLISIGLIYSATKTLDFSELQIRLLELYSENPGHVVAMAFSLFSAFAIKSGFFPFFFWLPESYPNLSPALSGVLAGLLTKLGLYAMLRLFSEVFPFDETFFHTILVLSVLTLLTGVWGAVVQENIREILSYHIISQVGFIGIAVSFSTHSDVLIANTAKGAAMFYIVHHIAVKSNLFFVSGLISMKRGSENLSDLGGLVKLYPVIALIFLIPAGSLIGIPPLSGFWAKLSLFKITIESRYLWVTIFMVIGSFFTLYSMLKIWNQAFWGENKLPQNDNSTTIDSSHYFAVAMLCFITLLISFFPTWLYQFSLKGDI